MYVTPYAAASGSIKLSVPSKRCMHGCDGFVASRMPAHAATGSGSLHRDVLPEDWRMEFLQKRPDCPPASRQASRWRYERQALWAPRVVAFQRLQEEPEERG